MSDSDSTEPRISPSRGSTGRICRAVETALNLTFPAVLRAQSWSAFDFLHADYDCGAWFKTSLVLHLSREIGGGYFGRRPLRSVYCPKESTSSLFGYDWAITVADDERYRARFTSPKDICVAGLTRVIAFEHPSDESHKTLEDEVNDVARHRDPTLIDCQRFAYIAIICNREKSDSLKTVITKHCRGFGGDLQVIAGYPWGDSTSDDVKKYWNCFAVLQLVLASGPGEDFWKPLVPQIQHRLSVLNAEYYGDWP